MLPKCLVNVGIATWAYAKVIAEWHGNASRMLLLRLLDAQQNESAEDEKPS